VKAMILAAGLGTRLQPLTLTKPKALLEVNGVPMLEIIIRKLIKHGFRELIINVHHFAGQIADFLDRNNHFGISITISDETDLLLDTGGGLLKARDFFNDGQPFLVHNVDILSDINLQDLYDSHVKNRQLATLAVKDRKTSRTLLINKNHELCGWHNNQTGQTIIAKEGEEALISLAFSAIHVVSPEIFPLISEKGAFSIMDTYLRLAKNYPILTWRHDPDFWMDLGRIENLPEAGRYMEHGLS
jgi:NDP-sugar pyrophosphorylase family protein